jgi:hypothetical protein
MKSSNPVIIYLSTPMVSRAVGKSIFAMLLIFPEERPEGYAGG